MEVLHVDLTAIAAILVGGAALLVPIIGITLRLVVPPVADALVRVREAGARGRGNPGWEQRVIRVERQLQLLSRSDGADPHIGGNGRSATFR